MALLPNPAGAATVGAGVGLSALGSWLTQQNALSNAQAQSAAANNVLNGKITNLDNLYSDNAKTFADLAGGYSPDAQAINLGDAQATRSARNVANVSQDSPDSVPSVWDAPPATRAARAKQMGDAFDYATNQAKASGALGGYNDAWFNNQMNNDAAQRNIGVTNGLAEGQKALIAPEQANAEAAAYKPPSIWGQLLSGAGGVLGSAGGTILGPAPAKPNFNPDFGTGTSAGAIY